MAFPFQIISSLTQHAPPDPDAGPASIIQAAKAAEADGVDSLLLGYGATFPDGWSMASYALANTSSISILLAHRPGIMSPALAARMAATLDVLSEGRLRFNIVAGGSIGDQMREGDSEDHDGRYARAIDYVTVLKKMWEATEPFDHDGDYYRLVNAFCTLKPKQKPGVPIYMGGSSDAATEFAVAHADAYMSWSEPVDMCTERFDMVRSRFASVGKPAPRFSVSMRLITADTEEEAWAKAEAMLPDDVEERRNRPMHKEDAGRNRQLSLVRDSMVHDERLWMGLAAATGGRGSTGALVGTPDQVRKSLLRYVTESGADTLLLTGADGAYEPLPEGFVGELRAQANAALAQRSETSMAD